MRTGRRGFLATIVGAVVAPFVPRKAETAERVFVSTPGGPNPYYYLALEGCWLRLAKEKKLRQPYGLDYWVVKKRSLYVFN